MKRACAFFASVGWWALSANAPPARALPPLATFVDAAGTRNVDNREAKHRAAQAEHEAASASGALLPNVGAEARYTRNQYQVKFSFPPPGGGPAVPFNVAPRDQYDVIFSIGVPLVDTAGWARRAAARTAAHAAHASKEATELDVERQVVAAYYRFAAALAVVDATNAARDAARENMRIAEAQRAAEVVPALDVQRATAELAAVEETIANAELMRELARRQLASLTGIEPADTTGAVLPDVSLDEEKPLAAWEGRAADTPSVRSASATARVDETRARAARMVLAPTLEASAQERFTNATAFSLGHSPFYTAMATANWRFDFTAVPAMRAQNEAASAGRVREERARIQASDTLHEAWWTVHADIAKVRAAAARAEAARAALVSARERYEAGAGTQLDALQAVRDAANADVESIQATANLAADRALLRIAAGESLRTGAAVK